MQQLTTDVNPQARLDLASRGLEPMLGAAGFVLLLGILVVFSLMTLGR